VYLRTRDRWPEGRPVIVESKFEHWWPAGSGLSCSIKWRTGDGATGEVEHGGDGRTPINVARTGHIVLDIDLLVYREAWNSPIEKRGTRTLMGTEHVRLAYDTAPTPDEIMPPVESAQLDALLKSMPPISFEGFFVLDPPHRSVLAGHGFDDVAIAANIEILHNGTRAMTAGWSAWLAGGTESAGGSPMFKKEVAYVWEHWSEPGWAIRLTSAPERAWELYGAKRYWKGEVVLPLIMAEPRQLSEFRPKNEPKTRAP